MKKLREPNKRNRNLREGDILACEICGKELPMEDMLSLAVGYRLPGPHPVVPNRKYPAYQCGDLQHFGCCHEHAMLAVIHCLFEHIHVGPHSESAHPLTHDKLQRIMAILEEEYKELVDAA